MPNSIELINISKTFQVHTQVLQVLDSFSMQFYAGQSYAITGVSGTGKTTLLHIIAGFDQPTAGKRYEHTEDGIKLQIGCAFQIPYLIKEMTVLENVMLPANIAGKSVAQAQQEAFNFLEKLGITSKAHVQPRALSGGQQYRVALARALSMKPEFLIADEMTASVDYATGQDMLNLVFECQQAWGMGIIMGSHDIQVINRCAVRVNLDNKGTLHGY